jgi:hypothetical protein
VYQEPRTGQVEIVRHVRNHCGNHEPHFFLADPAGGKLIAPDREDLVVCPVVLVNNGV